MYRDNLPSLQLQTWEMNANMYDGVSTAGPVPTIFSEDQQATIDAMVSDPVQAHKDVTKINRQESYISHINKNTLLFTITNYIPS
jgi:hypothetical protein